MLKEVYIDQHLLGIMSVAATDGREIPYVVADPDRHSERNAAVSKPGVNLCGYRV